MLELEKKEKQELLKFSEEYIILHGDILKIEKEMEELKSKSESLLNDLENCRSREDHYIKSLEKKYGEGFVNPITLCWEKETKENEIFK